MNRVQDQPDSLTAQQRAELELLRQENAQLRQLNQTAFGYVRTKVNDLLTVIGTKTLDPDELDDRSLIEFDPIGIVAQSFQHVLDNLRDTNRKLQFANQEIETIFETIGAALLVLNPQRRVVAYNQKTREMLLERNVDIHGQDCREVVCRARSDHPGCLFEKVLASGHEQHLDEWNLGDRSYNVIARPMHDALGKISHVVLVYTDVTARRNAELALLEALAETQEANAKIHGILRSASDGILVTDAEEHIVLINRRAEELFGLCLTDSPDDKPTLGVLPHARLVELIRRAPRTGQELLVEDLSCNAEDDRDRIYQARVTAIRSADGNKRGCITLLHDVTEERQVDRMKSDFVSTAAHELRTPLATIVGYTDLLLTGGPDVMESLGEYLQLIQEKAERLADIVSDLLDISRIESGEILKIDARPCDLGTLCREVVDNFRRQTDKHQFVISLPPEPVVALADRYAMIQVLENVVSNAVKYSPQGGLVELAVCQNEACCKLTVSDRGIGMTTEQLQKIFEKFYRADATNTAIAGTGLGMTIVRHLIEAQNGEVEVASSYGQGTRVTIRLPLAAKTPG
ncbi:MAG: ATP-binding protein [Desulfuromonadales bacterium]|nr:ATP-binding protein [Desulfuromonadales bacterium]